MSEEYDNWNLEPSPDNLGAVIRSLEPTINSEVHRYKGPKPLLRGKAKVLAVKAVKSYDPTRGAKLTSWVTTSLQPLSRYGQQMRPVHASEVAVRQAAEVNRIHQEMSDTLGRDPTPGEVSDEVGISVKRIEKLRRQVKPTVAESAFSDVEADGRAMPGVSESNVVGLAEDMVYDSLNSRDKQIHDWKVGRHGKAQIPNQEIAKRLGVTPALVSQRSHQIATQISEVATKRGG